MTEETATNPVEGDDLLPESGVETEAEATEPTEAQLDDDGNPIEDNAEPAEETEEVERDGKKYVIPKALKDDLLRQADYTRKTQELAEQRKALETEKATLTKANEELVNAKAELVAADKQLAQYERIDWRTWGQTDPTEANAAFFEYQQLQVARAKLAEDVTGKAQTLTAEAERVRVKQLQDGAEVLQRDIPGWGQDLAAKLADFGTKELGFTRQEIDAITDPRVVKLIHAAFKAKGAQTKNATVQKIAQQQATKPAATVGQSAPARKDPERMTTDEWMQWRNAQIAKRRKA